ncbi:HAD hydrolase-like protein [Paenibacillus thailandensis]|uniref:HAD hydrolase-like protein n=1 Tax=Paenibacillus thailandensis TaxID=393250 RepID=A0ABW5QSD8_9BACL
MWDHINLVDFDQVLFNTREALQEAYREAFNANGVDFILSDFIEFEGKSINSLLEKYEISEEIKEQIKKYKKNNYKNYTKYTIPNYDILSLPNKVIVSNAHSDDIRYILTYYGVSDVIDVIGRDRVKNVKPDPDPYYTAISLYPANNYTVYEDSDTGKISAKKAAELHNISNKLSIVHVDLYLEEYKGGSGEKIRRQGKVIDKITKSNQSIGILKDSGIRTPEIYFSNYEKIIMSFTEGSRLCDVYDGRIHFKKLIQLIEDIKKINIKNNASLDTYINRIKEHQHFFTDDIGLMEIFELCIFQLEKNRLLLEEERSFSHGDLTLSNILVDENELVVIDPNYQVDLYSSWLLDLAKILQSARGYEYTFGITNKINLNELSKLRTDILKYSGAKSRVVEILELSHWLRLLKYKKQQSEVEFLKAKKITLNIGEELVKWPIQQSF